VTPRPTDPGVRWTERPLLRAFVRLGPARVLRLTAAVLVIGLCAVSLRAQPLQPFAYGGDLWAYIAAGERLNAGSDLYALSETDRPVLLNPPYWSTPLLSPPVIAVMWRPIALVGVPGVLGWWLLGLALVTAVASAILLWGSWPSVLALVLLAPALALTAVSGNVNAHLCALLCGAWWWRDRPRVVGTAVAIAAAIKLTPILLVVWLLATGRRIAMGWFGVALVGLAVVSLFGAGLDAHLAWLAETPASAPSPLSVASLLGVSGALAAALVALGTSALVFVLRADRARFSLAILGATLAGPALYFQALALLAATLAPHVRRPASRAPATIPGPVDAR
jgi:alpha-1,2-mannosyltransferase